MKIGKETYNVNMSIELFELAKNDEEASKILNNNGCYRQACYFVIQAMEKYIRSHIFSVINPELDFFIKENSHHSLERAIELLIDIKSSNNISLKEQLKSQFSNVLNLKDIKYNHLHNNLRYPRYSYKNNKGYFILEISSKDYKNLFKILETLKNFLKDLDKL